MKKPKARPKLRRGLLTEVRRAFNLAEEMCGAFRPETIAASRYELRVLRNEVLRLLRGSK